MNSVTHLPAVQTHVPYVISVPSINWQYLIERRPAVLRQSQDLPPYLLLPEVRSLLTSIHDAHSKFLFSTLWHTGARISEALALKRTSFDLDPRNPHVWITTLKQRGRPRKGTRVAEREVPIRNEAYLDLVRTYFASERPRADTRLFNITRQAADARLRVIVLSYTQTHGALSIPVSCHTFRHSFAVNCLLHGRPLPTLQKWLGHADVKTTMIYLQVLIAETGHLMDGVEF